MSKKMKAHQSFSALPISYNDTTFYMTVIPSKILFDTSKVSRADEDKERVLKNEFNSQYKQSDQYFLY